MNQPQPSTCLSDQERMQDLLAYEKYLIDGYATFIPEAACPQLRQILIENLCGGCNSQYAVFDQMRTLGWYPTKPAPQADIDDARQTSDQLHAQLG